MGKVGRFLYLTFVYSNTSSIQGVDLLPVTTYQQDGGDGRDGWVSKGVFQGELING
jgi:hypothetical protein